MEKKKLVEKKSLVRLRDTSLVIQGRCVTAQELADLSDEWENPTVDTEKYYQAVLMSWEVTEQDYQTWKREGGLCQECNGKFYIA